jgi:hypothetical protein
MKMFDEQEDSNKGASVLLGLIVLGIILMLASCCGGIWWKFMGWCFS